MAAKKATRRRRRGGDDGDDGVGARDPGDSDGSDVEDFVGISKRKDFDVMTRACARDEKVRVVGTWRALRYSGP